MIEQTWLLLLIGAVCASLLMLCMWLVQVRIHDASHVDVAWAYGTGALGVLYAALGDGSAANRLLVALLAALWGGRLGTYLLVNRIIGKLFRGSRKSWNSR